MVPLLVNQMPVRSGHAIMPSGRLTVTEDSVGPRNIRTDQGAEFCASGSDGLALAPELGIEFYTGRAMFEAAKREFRKIRTSFVGMQYVIDHTDLCFELIFRLRENCVGRLILDRANFRNS